MNRSAVRGTRGLEEPSGSITFEGLTRFGALTSSIHRMSYLGSIAAINLFTGWTAVGLPGCHAGCCCLF